MSNDSVHRRILEMSSDIEKKVGENILQCSDFALQVDESTDTANQAQFIEFIGFIKENQITYQFLFCKELRVTARDENVFSILKDYLDKW